MDRTDAPDKRDLDVAFSLMPPPPPGFGKPTLGWLRVTASDGVRRVAVRAAYFGSLASAGPDGLDGWLTYLTGWRPRIEGAGGEPLALSLHEAVHHVSGRTDVIEVLAYLRPAG